MAKEHYLDAVADEVAEWMKAMEDYAVEMLLDDGRAPFAANVTEAQALDWYERQFFNADGSPNAAGRAKQLERLGPQGYAQAMSAVLKRRGQASALQTGQPAQPSAPGAMPPEVARNPETAAMYTQMFGPDRAA